MAESEECESRKKLYDGLGAVVYRRWVRVPFQEVWTQYVEMHGKISRGYFLKKRPPHVKSRANNPRCHCRWHIQPFIKARALAAFVRTHADAITDMNPATIALWGSATELRNLRSRVTCPGEQFDCAWGRCTKCGALSAVH